MVKTTLFAVGASLPLLLGALIGVRWRPPQRRVATALAGAAEALIASVSFKLFETSYQAGGLLGAGLSFTAGAVKFVTADFVLDRKTSGNPTGLALLAGVTLDGIPENTAPGRLAHRSGSVALLVAVFASNFPEALTESISMRDKGRSPRSVVRLAWVTETPSWAVRRSCWPQPFSSDDSRSPAPHRTRSRCRWSLPGERSSRIGHRHAVTRGVQ